MRAWLAPLGEAERPHRWTRVAPGLLRPRRWVRDLCAENRCGKFGRHPCCPPRVGSLQACGERLATYSHAVVLARTYAVNVADRRAVRRTRRAFQEATLALQTAAQRIGLPGVWAEPPAAEAAEPLDVSAATGAVLARKMGPWVWALPGGTCALCDPCPAEAGGACPRPDEAHPSLEALGVDVMGLLARLGWDAPFAPDRVTWVGALLWRDRAPAAGDAVGRSGAAGVGTEGEEGAP